VDPGASLEEVRAEADQTAALASALALTLHVARGPISTRVRRALPDLEDVHALALAESARLCAMGHQLEERI